MWDGEIEADAMADELVLAGVPRGAIVRERCSLTTRDNARFSAALLGRLGVDRVTVVTCDWHLPRAAQFFRAEGLAVEGVAAVAPRAPSVKRWVRGGHEWVSSHVDAARRALL